MIIEHINAKDLPAKKTNYKTSIISNFIIFVMLVSVAVLTLTFESQYVFGFNSSEAIYHGNKKSNNISLMINVYWGTEFVEPMLQELKKYDVSASFFIGGSWADKNNELLKQIHNAGHEIGNHGYFHKDHDKIDYDANLSEINITHKLVKQILGVEMNLFAPPSGAYNKTTLKVANELGYQTIMWSKDTIDWRDKNEQLILSRATKNVSGGELILMHPTEHTLKALPKMLEYYKNNGLNVVTVSQNLVV